MIRNISSNWVLILFQIGITFLLTPFTIRMLGEGQYGAWVLIASVTSYLSMLALGIPMATVRFVARYAGAGQEEELNRTVGSCAGLYLAIGAVAAAAGAVLFLVFDRVYDIPAAFRQEARLAFALVVVNVAASFIGQLPYGILSAYQEFVLRNKVQMSGLLLRLGLTYLLLSLRATMVWLAVIQIATFVLEFGVATWLVRRRYPGIRMRLADFDWPMVKEIFSFSVFVLVLNIGGQLVFQSDSLVIGAFLPLDRIPLFSVSSSLAVYLMEFVIGIAAVVMPMAATLQARDRMDELRDVYLKWSKITVSLTIAACLYLIVLGPRFLAWWIDPSFERPAGRVLQILMLGNLVFLPARGVAVPVLMGLGRPAAATLTFLATGVINLGMSIVLVRGLELDGVALGTAVPNTIFALVALGLAGRALGVTMTEYAAYAVVRPALAAVPVAAFLWWCRVSLDVRTLPALFAAGVASVVLGGLLALVFVYRGDPRVPVDGLLARLRGIRR